MAVLAAFPWSISPNSVKLLADTELTHVMRRLLTDEAHLRGCDISRVIINTEEKAGDEGCDAWTPAPPSRSAWLGASETCWQFKAGAAGQPAKLKSEIAKPIPAKTLRDGGRFVLVASEASRGEAGRRERLDVLQGEAKQFGLPTTNIEVLTSETLAQWLNQHPAISAPLSGLPGGIVTLEAWSRDRKHAGIWHPTKDAASVIEKAMKALDVYGDGLGHVHIVGRPGVGKTRFALELCKQAPWRESVLYVPQPADVSVAQILAAQAGAPERTLVLVVDEAPSSKLPHWATDAERCGGRVRLLTIGHSAAPGGTHVVEISIPPLERDAMLAAVAAWYPGMPREHVDFVVEFADGYVRLARLAADAVATDPTINVRALLQSPGVREFIATLLPAMEDRTALHVVAALNSVGWDGEIAEEGRVIAEHLGLNWTHVRARIQALDDMHGIAPRAGDLRYISPTPLGVYLAIDAWESYPDLMRSLRDKLPKGKAVTAYYDRLRAVMASPRARDIAVGELDRFFSWERFKSEADVERWAALSLADASRAAQLVRKALVDATHAQRLEIAGRARRDLVDALVELAWGEESFNDAALALAELAEAENETWGNNATGEFVARFQVFLGGTASPYRRRLEVIDELLNRGSAYQKLAVAALAQVGRDHESRSAPPPRRDAARPTEWIPRTADERVEAVTSALQRLERAASGALPELADAITSAARKIALLIRIREVRDAAMAFLRAAARAYAGERERIGDAVSDVISREVRFWKQLTEPEIASLRSLEEELQDNTPEGRIRRAIGRPQFDRDRPDLDPIAAMMTADPRLLESLWPWLTSGEANFGWDLGHALAVRDEQRALLPKLLSAQGRGRDARVTAGYLSGAAEAGGPGWIDDVLDRLQAEQPGAVQFVAELTWRCAPTQRGAERIQRLAEAGALEPFMVEQLTYGRWSDALPLEIFLGLLTTVTQNPRYREAALALAQDRVSSRGEEWKALKPLVLELLTDPLLARARSDMREYYWVELASKLAREHPRRIARALFAAQAVRDDENVWFLEHSQAKPVLDQCVAADPAGVWEELRVFLENPPAAVLFTAGFPEGLLEHLPHEAIVRWIGSQPDSRARIVADLVPKNLEDGTLGAEILTHYPKLVSGVFFSGWASGAWMGEASSHWDAVAAQLKNVAKASTQQAVRAWAEKAAAQFRRMADDERKREAEERLRRG